MVLRAWELLHLCAASMPPSKVRPSVKAAKGNKAMQQPWCCEPGSCYTCELLKLLCQQSVDLRGMGRDGQRHMD